MATGNPFEYGRELSPDELVDRAADVDAVADAIQRHRRVGYVFAGSATRLLADMTSDPARPFYKLGSVRTIGKLPRERGSAGLLSAEVTRRYRIGTSTMQKSIEALIGKGVLREELAEGESRARIEDPLFAAWVELVVPR